MRIEIKPWKKGHIVTIFENEKFKYSVTAPLSFVRAITRNPENFNQVITAIQDFDSIARNNQQKQ